MVFSASSLSPFSQSLRLFIATVCVVVLFILMLMWFLGTALVLTLFIVGKVGVIPSSTVCVCVCVCVLGSVAMVFMGLLFKDYWL